MPLHHPGQWIFLSPEELYFSSCDSVTAGGAIYYSLSCGLIIKSTLICQSTRDMVALESIGLKI
jgi:hypothetical protein